MSQENNFFEGEVVSKLSEYDVDPVEEVEANQPQASEDKAEGESQAKGQAKPETAPNKAEAAFALPQTEELTAEKARQETENELAAGGGTLKLSEEDLLEQYPNTDFGAGAGPGTLQQPRVVSLASIECAYASDTGRVRQNNEDSAVAFLGLIERLQTPFGFFAVADGMGGHENGEVASNIAVRSMMDGVMREFYLPTQEDRPLGMAGESPVEIMNILINLTNEAILDEGMRRFRNSMGTTLSCVLIFGRVGIIGHVGDSRIYVREAESGALRQVSRDHSVVARLVETGQITPQEALNHPQRSYLYMSLGHRSGVQPFAETLPLEGLSHLMICSDGLWDMIEDSEIEQILNEAASPTAACQQLINAALDAGGNDNVTVMVVKL